MSTQTLKRPCAKIGCGKLTTSKYCASHLGVEREAKQESDRRRESAAKRGYGTQWSKARAGYLAKYPLCVMCQITGRVTLANVVDHIKPHRGNMNLFWDSTNWQSLCASCHARKTAAYDGGFGNRSQ